MYRILEYALFFVAVLLLQVFLFNNLNLSVYINPLVYAAFIILLPMETPAITTLLLGLLLGVCTDFLSGIPGINTIATLFTAFCRPLTMTLMLGKEVVKEGGIPTSARIGNGKFIRYCSAAVLFHCIVYFSFEALSWNYFHVTRLKIVLSSVVTVILIYFSQMLLIGNYRKEKSKAQNG